MHDLKCILRPGKSYNGVYVQLVLLAPDQLVWHNCTLVLFNSKWSTIALNITINLGNYGSVFLECQGGVTTIQGDILLIFCKKII